MPKNVRKIPASVNLYNAVPITNKKKRKDILKSIFKDNYCELTVREIENTISKEKSLHMPGFQQTRKNN